MLLAVDTSTAQIGLALYDGVQIPGEYAWYSRAHHTQQLAPALAEMFERTGVKMSDLTAIGVALGPGSFTSLRVGLAFVKGLVLSRHLPLIGVPTLDIVAAAVPLSDRRLAAVVQAGRGRLAVGWFHAEDGGWQTEGPAKVMIAEELAEKIRKPVIVCGELSADDRQRLARKFKNVQLASPAQCVRRPGLLAELAWQAWQTGKVDTAASLAPIYLHVAGGLPA
jgi:tRNA threonylcarbamoyladenosine biosynthesis protein TsaB